MSCRARVDLLPDEPGTAPRYLLGRRAEAWDAHGLAVPASTPDALPVHASGAESVHESPVLPALWDRLALLVHELDEEAGVLGS